MAQQTDAVKAFSGCGHGVEEKSLITHLAKWNEDDKLSFWEDHPSFMKDQRCFNRLDREFVKLLRKEFLRFKAHLKVVYELSKIISGNSLEKVLGNHLRLKEAVQCLCAPQIYFAKMLDVALKVDADDKTKKALTRVIVTQADNIKHIREEFKNQYGVALPEKIEDMACGNYKDFLIALVTREN